MVNYRLTIAGITYRICTSCRHGFTLIEISIVLVIIGLLVGGILVGRDLIASAIVRAQITQVGKYTTALYAFKNKYNCLPGDCATAANFGFLARGSGYGQGDGDGIISGYGTGYAQVGETGVFWRDLSDARLIEGGFSSAIMSNDIPADVTGTALDAYFPQAKMGNGNYVYVHSGGSSTIGITLGNRWQLLFCHFPHLPGDQ